LRLRHHRQHPLGARGLGNVDRILPREDTAPALLPVNANASSATAPPASRSTSGSVGRALVNQSYSTAKAHHETLRKIVFY